ncbi:MAG TPA: surface-adhesin E family protein [Thermodesulfovibrionales bacterium]|nr:surface-adhesin E family protein [Thermodesulfovibrionales bacterium]
MKILVLMMLFGMSLIPGVSVGAEWTSITRDQSGDVDIFVDRESISHVSDATVRGWVKYRYSQPKQFDSRFIKELEVYGEYHCTERSYKIIRSIAYFADGTNEPDQSERQGHILRDDVVFEYLCK